MLLCLGTPVTLLRGGALGIRQSSATHVAALWCCVWVKDQKGNNATRSALTQLSVTFPTTDKRIGPFWCWFLGGWVCVHSWTPWVPPTDSSVRLGVSPATTTPTGFYSQRFWGFISLCLNPGFCSVSLSPVVPPSLSTRECETAWSASHCLALHPLHPRYLSPSLLPVWMNVSYLTPWLSDFHAVLFSGSSAYIYFLFLNLLLSFLWLCDEVKHIYLHLHFSWKSLESVFTWLLYESNRK